MCAGKETKNSYLWQLNKITFHADKVIKNKTINSNSHCTLLD